MPSYLLEQLSQFLDRIFGSSVEPESADYQSSSCGADSYSDETGDPESRSASSLSSAYSYLTVKAWWNVKVDPAALQVQEFQWGEGDCSLQHILAVLHKRMDNNELPLLDMPDNILKVLRLLDQPDFSFHEITDLISRSPSMAGEFMKIVNSSIYSRGVVITDLKTALPRLGKANIKAFLYLYSARLRFSKNPSYNPLVESIVAHSYATGIVAAFLSQRYFASPDTAFLAGLLHDIGKLSVIKAIVDENMIPEELLEQVAPSELTFAPLLTPYHERVGTFLASNWKIEPTVMTAIEHHHDFQTTTFTEEEDVGRNLACLISLSDTIARMLGYGRPVEQDINLFEHPAVFEMDIEPNKDTIDFFADIPHMLNFKLEPEPAGD